MSVCTISSEEACAAARGWPRQPRMLSGEGNPNGAEVGYWPNDQYLDEENGILFVFNGTPGTKIGWAAVSDFVNVQSFGAVVDGVTDDSSAIQLAINAAKEIGTGMAVYVPGSCVVNTGLVWEPGNNQNIHFFGNGISSELKTTVSGITIFTADQGPSNFQFLDIHGFKFNTRGYDSRAIFLKATGQLGKLRDLLIDVDASLVSYGAIDLGNIANGIGPTSFEMEEVKIRGGGLVNEGGGAQWGIRFLENPHSVVFKQVKVQGCVTAISNSVSGAHATAGTNLTFREGVFENNGTVISLTGFAAHQVSISSCRFEDFTVAGIFIQGFDATTNVSQGISIRSNYFSGLRDGRVCIKLQRVGGWSIEDNTCSASGGVYPAGNFLEFVSAITNGRLATNRTITSVEVRSSITGYALGLAKDNAFVNQITLDAENYFPTIFTTGCKITSSVDGNLILQNYAGTGFTFLAFGGVTNVKAGIKSVGNTLLTRLGDDSGFCSLQSSSFLNGSENARFSSTGLEMGSTPEFLWGSTGAYSAVKDVGLKRQSTGVIQVTDGGVGGGNLMVGNGTIDADAVLQADSTTKGFLPPRMTKAQRDAIVTPPNGLMIYQTDGTAGIKAYISGAWYTLDATADP